VVAGWWETSVVVFLDFAARAMRRARALTEGGWGWATSGICETCLGAGIPGGKVDALPAFHMFGWAPNRTIFRFAAATVFAVLTV
jgi:hypothetical protein